MSRCPNARKAMLLDSLEAYALHGGAPITGLFNDACGAGLTPPMRADMPCRATRSDLEANLGLYLGATFSDGHDLRALQNGDEIFPAMLACIQSASESIEFLSYILENSDIASRFCRALIERANAGVSVRVLLDGVGSSAIGAKLLAALENSPVELAIFNPVPGWKFWRFPSRNHRKILVVDARVAFTGGVGVAKQWEGNGSRPGEYRDTHFRITGPAVAQMRSVFFNDWACAGAALPATLRRNPKTVCYPGRSRAAVVACYSASKNSRAAWLLQLLTRCARDSITFITPYFVPGRFLEDALASAARRGVDVDIVISGRNTDHRLPLWAGRASYARLLASGARLSEYQRTLLHCKLVIVDQKLVCLGSINVNQRSQSQDEEIAVLAWDEALARQLLDDTAKDRKHCRQIDPEGWARRPWYERLRERLCLQLAAHL